MDKETILDILINGCEMSQDKTGEVRYQYSQEQFEQVVKKLVNKTNDIHSVMPRVKETIEQLLKESEESEKEIEKYGKDTMALAVQKAHSYSFAIALQVIKRYEA